MTFERLDRLLLEAADFSIFNIFSFFKNIKTTIFSFRLLIEVNKDKKHTQNRSCIAHNQKIYFSMITRHVRFWIKFIVQRVPLAKIMEYSGLRYEFLNTT